MTQTSLPKDESHLDNLPAVAHTPLPVHEILNRLAVTITPDIAAQLSGLETAEVKSALEYAASVVCRKNSPPPDNLPSGNKNTALNLKKVLAVDDVEQNRLLMKHMLTRSGFTPLLAANGDEAFEIACAERPALIISDIMMPGTSGLELLKKLKTNEPTKNIAVILVTAHYRDAQRVSQGLNLGANDYIQRPFSIEEFISRVKAVIRIKEAEATAQEQTWLIQQRNRGLNLVNELALAVNSSPDMKEIFTSSVQNLSQLFEAEAVCLLLFDEDKQQLTVNISSSRQKYISVVINSAVLSMDQVPTIVLQIIEQNYNALNLTAQPSFDAIQTVPVHSREWQTVGAIAIINKPGHSISEADWILLHSAGNIIAMAIENARLLENAQQQVDDLIALNDIGRILSSTLELDRTFAQTTNHVQQLIHSEITSLWVLNNNGQNLKLMASSIGKSALKANPYIDLYCEIAKHVAKTGEPFLTADVSRQMQIQSFAVDSATPQPRSILCVPAKFEHDIVGVILSCHPKTNQFFQNHLRLSYPIANSVGTAIKNAQLFAEVQEFNDFLEQIVETRTQQLAEEREKTETILANMADGLLVLDANNYILTANTAAEKMLDVKLSELLGVPLVPAQPETPLWQCIKDIAGNTNPTVTVTVDVPQPQSDQKLSIEAHAAKVQGDEQQVIGTVIVLRDITTLKEVERMKARFMAGITHELKTPLAVIQLHSKNLATYYHQMPDDKRNELLQAIQNQTKLLKQLVENILHLSRYDNGMVNIKKEPVGTVKIIDQVVTDLRPLAKAKQIALHWEKPRQEITIKASANHIERVVRNLLDNAIKYTPPNQSITVKISIEPIDKQPWAKITVADTGVGIPAEHQAQIFERFYRVDPSHTVPGSGLGLAIVKEIVNLHHGTVQLKSAPGRGSEFTITLPVIG